MESEDIPSNDVCRVQFAGKIKLGFAVPERDLKGTLTSEVTRTSKNSKRTRLHDEAEADGLMCVTVLPGKSPGKKRTKKKN